MATVLVVDNEASSLRMVGTLIRVNLNVNVITAGSGREALEMAPQADVILTDVVMPEMDGFQLCRRLKEREETRDIPIIFMTAYLGDIADRTRGLELGAIDYMMKPLNEVMLTARLRNMLWVREAKELLRQAQWSTQEQMHLFLAAMESTSEGITISNEQGTWLFVNPAQADMFGYTVEEFMGTPVSSYYDEESNRILREEAVPALKKSGTWAGELKGLRAGGDGFPLLLSLNAIKSEANKFLGVMGITRDISSRKAVEEDIRATSLDLMAVNRTLQEAYDDLKNAQQALLDAERLKTVGEMARGLAHDIKNLLGALEAGVAMVEHSLVEQDDETLRDGWQIVKSGQERVRDLVADLLYCSRETKPEVDEGDIGVLVKAEVEMFREQNRKKGIEFSLDLEGGIDPFFFDFKSIRRSIDNLLNNAVDAVADRPDPRISVAVRLGPQAESVLAPEKQGHLRDVEISVTDNGKGIPEDQLPRVFELLYTTKPTGIGLGLAIVKKAVGEHGGRVLVSSRPGQGTTFTIVLPRRRTDG